MLRFNTFQWPLVLRDVRASGFVIVSRGATFGFGRPERQRSADGIALSPTVHIGGYVHYVEKHRIRRSTTMKIIQERHYYGWVQSCSSDERAPVAARLTKPTKVIQLHLFMYIDSRCWSSWSEGSTPTFDRTSGSAEHIIDSGEIPY